MTLRVAAVSAAVLSIVGTTDPAIAQIIPKPTVTVSASQASIAENPNAVARTTSTTSLSTSPTGGATFTVRIDVALPVDVSLPYAVSGTAVAGRDYRALSGSVLIRAGQTTGTITVTSIDDSEDEADETITIAIVSTSSSPYVVGRPGSASTTIIDDDQVSIVAASFEPESVLGGESSDLRVTLSGAAPPGGLAVRVQSYNTDVVSDGRTTIPAGAREGRVTVTTTPQLSSGTVQVTVDEPNGSSILAYLAVLPEPAVTWVVFAESEMYGGGSTTAYVQINTLPPPGGLSFPVSVAVLSPGGVTSPLNAPSTVTIAEGSTSTRMNIPTAAVTTLTRVAMTVGSGTRTFTDTLTVHPAPVVESISVTPGAVGSGQPVDVTVRMVAPVPAVPGGWTVYLSGSGPVDVPSGARLEFASGASEATMQFQTPSVAVETEAIVRVSDSPGGTASQEARFRVAPPTVTSVRLGFTETFGGRSHTGDISLSAPAPATGLTVPIRVGVVGSAKSVPPVSAPKSVTFAPRATTALLNFETTPVSTPTEVQVLAGGSLATITIHPTPRIEIITATPDPVTGGSDISIRVQLDRPNPIATRFYVAVEGSGPLGITTPLLRATSNSAGYRVGGLPFEFGERESSFSFATEAVAVTTNAEIRFEDIYDATNSAVTTLQVAPPSVEPFTFHAEEMFGGDWTGTTLRLNADAPVGGLTLPVTLTLPAGGSLTTSAPASVTFPEGTRQARLEIETQPVAAVTSMHVEVGGYGRTVEVHPTPRIESITATPDPVPGGSNVSISVRLDRPNPISRSVYVAVDHPFPLVVSPYLRTVVHNNHRGPALAYERGEREASFGMQTTAVAVATSAEIHFEDIYDLSNSAVATLRVTPPSVEPFTLYAAELFGGDRTGATLRLNVDAPVGGLTVPVTLTVPAGGALPASAPASVTFPEGTRQANLGIETLPVAAVTTVQVEVGGSTTTFAVHPTPRIESITATPDPVPGGSNVSISVRLDRPNPISRSLFVAVDHPGPFSRAVSPLLRSVVYDGRRVGALTFSLGEREASFGLETTAVTVVTPAELSFADIFDPSNSGLLNFDVVPKPPVTFSALTFNPSRIAGAAAARAELVVTEPPSADVLVNLTSDRPQTGSVPPSIVFRAGATMATFPVITSDVASTEAVRITATNGGQQIAQTLTVDPAPPALLNVVPMPPDVIGGGEVELAVTLTKPAAPGGFTATLQSADPSIVPAPIVQVAAGQQTGIVRVRTAAVPAARSVSVGLSPAPNTTIALRAIPLDRVQTPGSVRGAGFVTVEIRLLEAAPAGGLRVPLASSDASVAAVPAFVDIPAGALSAGVQVQLGTVAADTQVTITAGIGPGAVSREFRVRS